MRTKRVYTKVTAILTSLLLGAGIVSATPIYFDGGDILGAGGSVGGDGSTAALGRDPDWTNNDNSNPKIDEVKTITGYSGKLVEVYKSNVGGVEEKAFAGDYTTTYANTPGDPEDATISWDGPGVISGSPLFLLAKGGGPDPSRIFWDITGWDGMMDLRMVDLWPSRGAISHVSIYAGDNNTVPEGGVPVAMLGLLFVSMFVAAKRKNRQ